MSPRIRLIQVVVQPVFVLDHGDRLEPVDHPLMAIPGEEWSSYSGERFQREVVEWQERLDAETDGRLHVVHSGDPGSRAARRARAKTKGPRKPAV